MKQCQPRAAPAKLSVITRGKIKALHDKNSLKEFMTTKPARRNILEGILQLRKKTKPPVKPKERINHTRLIVKKRRRNQTRQKSTKWQEPMHTFNNNNLVVSMFQCTPFNNNNLVVSIGLDQKA